MESRLLPRMYMCMRVRACVRAGVRERAVREGGRERERVVCVCVCVCACVCVCVCVCVWVCVCDAEHSGRRE